MSYFLEIRQLTNDCSLSVALPLNLMYGYTPTSFTDPAVYAAEQSLHLGATLYLPGTTLANVFPILTHIPSWFPGAGFKRKAERAKFLSEESKRIPWEFTQKEFVSEALFVSHLICTFGLTLPCRKMGLTIHHYSRTISSEPRIGTYLQTSLRSIWT